MWVETIAKIRREHFVHGKSIKSIARRRGVSRNTVRKVLRSTDTEFRYERESQPLAKLGGYVATLDQWLEEDRSKPRRERLRLIRLYEQLCDAGYEGGYDVVRRYTRRWQRERTGLDAEVYVPHFVVIVKDLGVRDGSSRFSS